MPNSLHGGPDNQEGVPRAVAEAIAEDARTLAALHDRELTPEMVAAVKESGLPWTLGLLPNSSEQSAAWHAFAEAVAQLPASDDHTLIDELAAEYAAFYLTGRWGISPYESVWVTEDRITCQEPMFELRQRYQKAGLTATDWRQRAEDHLVLQLLYIAHMAEKAGSSEAWRSLAEMVDEHIGFWIRDFARQIVAHAAHPFYAALAVLTAAWVERLRDVLALLLDYPPPSRQEIATRLNARRAKSTSCHGAPPTNIMGPTW